VTLNQSRQSRDSPKGIPSEEPGWVHKTYLAGQINYGRPG